MLAHHQPLVLIGRTVTAGGSGVLAHLGIRWAVLRGSLRRKDPCSGPLG